MNMQVTKKAKSAPAASNSCTRAPGLLLQRKCACGSKLDSTEPCDDCFQKETTLQRRATNDDQQAGVPNIVQDVLRAPGQPLNSSARAAIEPYFGHSFGQVRVHTDGPAADSAKSVNALAYTVGDHIVFAAGQYSPSSISGMKLLTHELTHVVQQQSGAVAGQQGIGPADAIHEQQADDFADRVSRMMTQMKMSQRDSSSIMNGLDKGMSEDEDTQMSTEPLDPRFLYQNGTTTCTFPAGTPSTVINNTDCASPCTRRHEGVHFTDITPCCAKAGTAHAAAATPAAKQTVENQFFAWMSGNRSWFECRAYAESVRCADEMIAARNCTGTPAPADTACCATLAAYRADKETRRASNCAAGGSLSACPFP